MRSIALRALALFGTVLLVGAVAVAVTTPPAARYEVSLYAAFPGYFWLFLVGAMFAGAVVIAASATATGERAWLLGVPLVLLSNALLVFMPYIRGYPMYGRSDPMTHIGFVRDVVATAGIEGNIYPPTHLLVAAVAGATGRDPTAVGLVAPIVASAVYFGAMFYLLCFLFDARERILLGLPFVLLPVLGRVHVNLRPYDLSIMLAVLALYLFVKSQQTAVVQVRFALVVVLVAVLLYHPLTALFLLGMFPLWLLGKYVPRVSKDRTTPSNVVSLSGVVFVAWYSNYTGIILRFESVWRVLFGTDEGETHLQSYAETTQEASPALIDLVRVATFRYGTEFVLFGLAFLFVTLVLLLAFRGQYPVSIYMMMTMGTAVLFSVGGLLFLSLDLIVPHDRPWKIAKIAAVVLAGQLFYVTAYALDWDRYGGLVRGGTRTAMTVTVLVIVVLSVFSFYPSPLASSDNSQVTEMEAEGTEWLTEHRAADAAGLSEFDTSYRRYHHARYGRNAPLPFWGTTPPPRFNYTNHASMGEGHADDRYLTITRRGRIHYPRVFPTYPENWRYTPADFERIERDRTVDRVYDNGDYNQYLVNAARPDGAA